MTRSRLKLDIKAPHDARISLRTHLGGDSNEYEIIIGGWGNRMSVIRRNNEDLNVAEAETRNILDVMFTCHFWIQWRSDGTLNVGRENMGVFLSYKDRNPFVINYIGLGTAWGATGEFLFQESYSTSTALRQQIVDTSNFWVDFNASCGLPQNATKASEDGLYIGRANFENSLTPGSVRNNVCMIPWGGISNERNDFQVLCAKNVNWVKSWDGSVPLHALPTGETEDDYVLFIGRVLHEGVYYVGKVQHNHQTCYVPISGQEVSFRNYETLVICDYYMEEYIGR
ncbi:uncharacterized protein LOC108632259 isoform X2 [Ceratina calcarata]|nr:uncharacterized protein LOC108632259 isoform X2 [Ceratina calcarata]